MGIRVRSVSKTFYGFKALDQVNLKIQEGELMALLGPSGSGKTTLLRIIAGIDRPDRGTVLLFGKDIRRLKASDRRVGFVFQHYALFKHMNVFENIAFGLKVRPAGLRPSDAEIKKKVGELLTLVQLDRMASRYPSELSGGQRQRVALARALAIEPELLLLDEPFGALDAKVRRDLRLWLRKLHEEIQITSVFVTHDQEEALELADRVAVLNEGRIEQVGTPEEIYHRPATPFVYDFLGNVNLFHCRIEDGKAFLRDSQVELSSPGFSAPTQKDASIYVRPHLLEIHREAGAQNRLSATIRHIHLAGPTVKIELESPWGDLIRVELTHERYRELKLRKEEKVFVSPKEITYFEQDYSI